MAIDIISSDEEHQLITSNPEDVLNKRKLLAVKKKQEEEELTPTPIITPTVKPQPQADVPLMETPTPKEEVLEQVEENKSDEIEDVLQRKIDELEKVGVKDVPLSGEIKPNSQVKFVPPKMEVVEPEQKQKPVFIKTEETNIPQPVQLAKKPQPIFDSKQGNKSDEETKPNHDDLLGGGII